MPRATAPAATDVSSVTQAEMTARKAITTPSARDKKSRRGKDGFGHVSSGSYGVHRNNLQGGACRADGSSF